MQVCVPCGGLGPNVLGCVVYVVIMVELVVMCCRCDDDVHGEIYGGLEEDGRMQGWWLCGCVVVLVIVIVVFGVMVRIVLMVN